MTNKKSSQFRERFTEIGGGLQQDKSERPVLPSTEGLRLDTSFDISQLDSFAAPQVEIKGVADKVKQGMEGLRVEADLGKLHEGIEKIRRQQVSDQIRGLMEEAQRQIAKKLYRPAIKTLDKALAVDPTSTQVLFLKGYCLFGLGEHDPALDVLNEARNQARDLRRLAASRSGCSFARTAALANHREAT